MKKYTDGYKGMIRDRVPIVVDFALKWCEVKTEWVNHVYKNFVQMYSSKEDRQRVTKIVLGLSKRGLPINFDFVKTLDWDNMSKEDEQRWKWVCDWVAWFRKQFLYVHNVYKNNLEGDEAFKTEIKKTYLSSLEKQTQEELASFLLNCCKKYE